MPKRRSSGDGAIYFDEKRNLYVGQVTLGRDEKGKRKRKTVYANTKSEVKAKLKNIQFQVFTGTFVDKNDVTFFHLAKQVLDDKLNQNEIKDPSYFRHMETLKILSPIYNNSLQTINETQIRTFLNNNLHYSQSVLNKVYILLNKTFREAIRRKIITENPMEDIKRPNSKKQTIKVRALTKDEQRKLLNVLLTEDVNYKYQMLLSMAMGFRMGEINALHVEDVNFNFNRISVKRTISRGQKGEPILGDTPKTKAGSRVLTMTDDVRALFRECIGNKKSGLIFIQKDKLITTSQVNSQFQRILKKYDIIDETIKDGKLNLHSLRHTFGTRCAEAGMPPKVLQEIMGHTDIKVTMNTYFYATEEYMKENLYKVDAILKGEGLSINPNQVKNKLEFA